MRLGRSMSTSSSGGTGLIPPNKLAILSAITVTAVEINRVSALTSALEGQINGKMPISGGTFTGMLTLAGDPGVATNLATKSYVDTTTNSGSGSKIPLAGGTMTGQLILAANAASALQPVSKQQLDTGVVSITPTFNTTGIATWTGSTNEQVGAGWTAFKAKLQAVVTENRRNPLAGYSKIAASGTFTTGLSDVVLLSDGRVFCVPHTVTTARIYDPVTDTVSTPTGSYTSYGNWSGLLLKDGRVFMTPGISLIARIYDPITDTLVAANVGSITLTSEYMYSVLLPNGKVFMIPFGGTTARIYDPVTNTVSTAGGTYAASSLGSGVLLPDGRVFMVPYGSTTARIYDYVTDTVSTPNGTYPTPAEHRFGLLLSDGRVYMPPMSGKTTARIYDPVANTLVLAGGVFSGNNTTRRGTLLPDGRVFMPPGNGSTAYIYDPVTDALTVTSTTYAAGSSDRGVLMADGSVFMMPYDTTAYIARGRRYKWPKEFLLSPFFNRN
jgi:hypothetical protein